LHKKPKNILTCYYSQIHCATAAPANSQDEVGLVSGTYPSLTSITGIAGPQNFDNRARSLSCSVV